MSDMRLIVAGAGGRMGRALTRVISETSGAVLTGALEAPGSELLELTAAINWLLAVFNLVPLLPTDGYFMLCTLVKPTGGSATVDAAGSLDLGVVTLSGASSHLTITAGSDVGQTGALKVAALTITSVLSSSRRSRPPFSSR